MSNTTEKNIETVRTEDKDPYAIDIIDVEKANEDEGGDNIQPLGFNSYLIFGGVLFAGMFSSLLGSGLYPLATYIVGQLEAFDLNAIPAILNTLFGLFLLPFYAKTSDIFGRMPLLVIAILFIICGNIAYGFSQNFLVYSVGSIIRNIGNVGKTVLIPVILADLLIAKNRGLGFFLYWVPNFLAIFASLPLVEPFKQFGWRYIYFILAVGTALTSIPLFFGLYRQRQMLKKPAVKSAKEILIEIDAVGLALLTISLGLILLPFSLVIREPEGWASPMIIAMLVVGSFFLILLFVWEFKYCKQPLIPKRILQNKPLMILILVHEILSIDSSINWAYFTSYLIISRDISETHVAILNRGFQISWYIAGFIVGYLIKKFKWTRSIIWVGCVVNVIGLALTVPARHPGSPDALVITAEAFIGAGSGMFACIFLVMTQSLVEYKDIATITAIIALLNNIFSSIASAVATAIWNTYLSKNLAYHLPTEYASQIPSLLKNLYLLRKLPLDIKTEWIAALGDTQLIMSSISITIACIGAITSIFVKPLDLK